MPITQISRIQNRRGLQENLPILASGELGWAVDSRKLYIGNGTIAEGAPSTGVTEVLTQYSTPTVFVTNLGPAPVGPVVDSLTMTSNNSYPQGTALTINNATVNGASIEYVMTRTIGASPEIRKGVVRIGFLNNGLGETRIAFDDNYIESANLGIILSFASTSLTSGRIEYTSPTMVAGDAVFTYAVNSSILSA